MYISNTAILDKIVLSEMKRMYRQGYVCAKPITMSKRVRKRKLRIDLVQALGAMLRVLRKYRLWVNSLAN